MVENQHATLTVTLTANQLRALAEEADGFRNVPVVVVPNPNGDGGRPYKVVREDQHRGTTPVMRLQTDDEPPFAERTPKFTLYSEPPVTLANHPGRTLADCDAVFTSLSAVDKFVVPYYGQMRELTAVQRARDEFALNAAALAVVHLPDSVDDTLRASGSMYTVVAKRAQDGQDGQDGVDAKTSFLREFIGDFIRK